MCPVRRSLPLLSVVASLFCTPLISRRWLSRRRGHYTVWKLTSELGYSRVDGVGRPKFNFHTGFTCRPVCVPHGSQWNDGVETRCGAQWRRCARSGEIELHERRRRTRHYRNARRRRRRRPPRRRRCALRRRPRVRAPLGADAVPGLPAAGGYVVSWACEASGAELGIPCPPGVVMCWSFS